MVERLSLTDNSLLAGYAENIQRCEFALKWCRGGRVLDAGSGSGYGAYFLARNGALSVLGIDLSADAVAEANASYQRDNLRFEVGDLQALEAASSGRPFDAVVSFETLAHLAQPARFLRSVQSALGEGGTFIASTPNGERVAADSHGKPLYRFQHKAYSAGEFAALLSSCFAGVVLYGHWLTHQGRLRKLRSRECFAQLTEAYYNPLARVGRAIKRVAGRTSAPPPVFTGEADSYAGDYVIAPLAEGDLPWPPTTLIAVCSS